MSSALPIESPVEDASPASSLPAERCQGLKGCSNEASHAYYHDGRARFVCSECDATFSSY